MCQPFYPGLRKSDVSHSNYQTPYSVLVYTKSTLMLTLDFKSTALDVTGNYTLKHNTRETPFSLNYNSFS